MRSIFLHKPDPLELRLSLTGFRGKVWVWLPAVVAVLVIANESTQRFSADHTSGFLRPIFERYLGRIPDAVWGLAHHIARKSGHFIGYGTVCLTFVRAWLLTLGCVADLRRAAWRWRSVGLGLLCTFLVASGDEFHQTFVPGRTGLFSDVVLDTCGGMTACGLVWFLFWRSKRRGSSTGGSRRRIRSRRLAQG